MRRCDSVFTVFGPLYRWAPRFRSIVGFAQPWIIYPDNECYARLSPVNRMITRIKFWLQGHYFKRADILVVELEHVKEGLIRELGIDPDRIHVVHNCLSAIYDQNTRWEAVDVPKNASDLCLGFLGRNYAHKNTSVFPEVARLLRERHGISAKFYVTFTDDEWHRSSPEFRSACVNVGPLSVAQCPLFYDAMDAVVFPSLLECFSATPLEAMATRTPLFVSDRPFNRDVCRDHAWYFDPLSPISAADSIAQVMKNGGPGLDVLETAKSHAISFSTPARRAQQILALLMHNDDADPTSLN